MHQSLGQWKVRLAELLVDRLLIEVVFEIQVVAFVDGLIHHVRLVTFLLLVVLVHVVLVTVDDVLGDVGSVDIRVEVGLGLVEFPLLLGLVPELGKASSLLHHLHQVELNRRLRNFLGV